MGVFEGRFRIAVPEQPCDGEDGFALPQGDAGVGVAKIVKPNVAQVRLGADPRPEMVQPASTPRCSRPGRREDPSVDPLEPVEDVPCRTGKPDGSGTRFAVAQEETAFAVIGPAQGKNLALAASGQEKKADGRDLKRLPAGMGGQRCGQAADLVIGQEAFASLCGGSAGCRGRGWSPRAEGPLLPPPA